MSGLRTYSQRSQGRKVLEGTWGSQPLPRPPRCCCFSLWAEGMEVTRNPERQGASSWNICLVTGKEILHEKHTGCKTGSFYGSNETL